MAVTSVQTLIKRFGIFLLLMLICRLVFFGSNYTAFSSESNTAIALSFLVGLRFDITVFSILFSPLVLFHVLVFSWNENKFFSKFFTLYFITLTSLCALVNLSDAGFYKFSNKRSTFDFFQVLTAHSDTIGTVPDMIKDHWYLFIFFIGCVLLASYLSRSIKTFSIVLPTYIRIVIKVVLLSAFLIGFRGGLQLKPLRISSAAKYSSATLAPLALNTAFTMIKTSYGSDLELLNYLSEKERLDNFNLTRNYSKDTTFQSKNVVIILLESFSAEYSSLLSGNAIGYMPFTDSLMQQSLYCTNAFANGKRSIEALPAVLSSIPVLMSEPFITSNYNSNRISSPVLALKNKNYQSAFFHGGANGTMGFDNFSSLAGFDRYYGKDEYPFEKNFDGKWGIYDEPYLQYAASEMSKMKQPFISCIFTLSSHHPYSVPPSLSNNFTAGSLPIHKSISYADYALRQFFESASKTEWYQNTLFVIAADHTGPYGSEQYAKIPKVYSIPIFLYSPSDLQLKGKIKKAVQQLDLFPSIMDYLNYDQTFYSFGSSFFRSEEYPIVFYSNELYYVWNKTSLIEMSAEELGDKNQNDQSILNFVRAFTQAHNEKLKLNTLQEP
ncbi:MAG TPA: sulfatase-like hydrolase/transferase [Bacteroidia bacterium]|nr:sulfatase-like hydrolase/transferase [Bacteroidia bacterium]HNT80975.1 sulfatase-like hydrolase/transferase [Bacteroidia bacterium]